MGLLKVGVRVLVGVPSDVAGDGLLGPSVRFVLDGAASRVGLVVSGELVTTAVNDHGSITKVVVAHLSAVGAVDRNLLVVLTESMTVGVRVVKETALQHLVHGGFDTRNQVGGSVSNLLSLGVVVGWVSIQGNFADRDERVIRMGPHLGNIEDIKSVLGSVRLRHSLDKPVPAWVVTLCNLIIEVIGAELGVLDTHSLSFRSSEALDALGSLVVVLDIVDFILVVHPSEGVRRVAVHVAVTVRGASVAHEDGDLVESLRRVRPEVEGRVGVLQVVGRVSLLGVDEVGELDGILDEEYGSVVANHIVVALLGVMLDGEATGVTIAIVGAALTSDGREAGEDGGLFADLVHEFGLAETKE